MKPSFLLSTLTFTIILAGCGGNSSSSNNPSVNSPVVPVVPTVSKVIKTGTITGFGSIYIDGKRYITDNAAVTTNGNTGRSITDLSVGMRVSLLVNESNDGSDSEATQVSYERDIEGLVVSIDRNNNLINVAGTAIAYNNLTHFIGVSESSLRVGERIEASGIVNQQGQYIASYIEIDNDESNDGQEYTIGFISNLDVNNQTFELNSLTVNFAEAIGDTPSAGALVKVAGQVVNGVFTASYIDIEGQEDYRQWEDDAVNRLEIHGIITALSPDNTTLSINGVVYNIAENVVLEGTSSLVVNDLVEIYVNTDTNTITKIELENEQYRHDGKVKGTISEIDSNAKTITVNGVLYAIVASSRFEDDNDQFIRFEQLSVNDKVEVVFVIDSQGQRLIQRLDRESDDEFREEWELEGPIQNVDDQLQRFSLNGVEIQVNNQMRLFVDDTLVMITPFFAALTASSNLEVEVEGQFINGEFVVTEIEVESQYTSNESDDIDYATVGYAELEGTVTEVLSTQSFRLNGIEIRVTYTTDFEFNDQRLTLNDFMTRLSVGNSVEVEGVWVDDTYIQAYEVEIELMDND
ncbi:DUF5666 domain-containing protein [Opacimonas viscosa]|uniref:DUF5666 domain-containing protein n=1 Tax=Opacimonas viscosa TaxID=2961944 RepID=A0AA42BME6_9ALTE|nr:DUF5666 domain-containing protein [Opacimonas viscosa]MCP3429730.1 DUF5666 domain-containing protein [Opacimonas viscosa]